MGYVQRQQTCFLSRINETDMFDPYPNFQTNPSDAVLTCGITGESSEGELMGNGTLDWGEGRLALSDITACLSAHRGVLR